MQYLNQKQPPSNVIINTDLYPEVGKNPNYPIDNPTRVGYIVINFQGVFFKIQRNFLKGVENYAIPEPKAIVTPRLTWATILQY